MLGQWNDFIHSGCIGRSHISQKYVERWPHSLHLQHFLSSFKESGEFHEQCIEDIFSKLQSKYSQEKFEVCGRFLRRGGIDINPIRSSKKSLFFKNYFIIIYNSLKLGNDYFIGFY